MINKEDLKNEFIQAFSDNEDEFSEFFPDTDDYEWSYINSEKKLKNKVKSKHKRLYIAG